MGMFDTAGISSPAQPRKPATLRKAEPMSKTLRHQNPIAYRSAISFGAVSRAVARRIRPCRGTDPYYHYDLDWIVTIPNMDPRIRPFQVLRETSGKSSSRRASARRCANVSAARCPSRRLGHRQPGEARSGRVRSARRPAALCAAGDNHLAGVGDGFQRNSPAWSTP